MKLHTQFNIAEEDAKRIVGTIAEGGFSLLSGAGASYGAEGGDKKILKGGADLAEELNDRFMLGLDESDKNNLSLVYGDIKEDKRKKVN